MDEEKPDYEKRREEYEEAKAFIQYSWWFVLCVFIVGMAVGIYIGLIL